MEDGMITVHNVHGKPAYDIVIKQDFAGLATSFGKLGITGRKICIVTESNVGPLYADEVRAELEKTGNEVYVYTFEAGEKNKNLDTVEDVYEFLIGKHFDRNDVLAALGGGVVGDLTGFTAATYLRGVKFIQIPTSLLAQVDSSIGGKTGVDFRSFKNMVGAFHQPSLVYMNMSALKTLDERQYNSGLGEIIKHGLIKDRDNFDWLVANAASIKARDMDTLEKMIEASCNIKRQVVEKDPKEKGDRALLNYGHTLGHAIEKLAGFQLYHGECVVLGILAALEISRMRGYLGDEDVERCRESFRTYGFPMTVSHITPDDIVKTSKSDKKMDAGQIKFILLRSIGDSYVDRTVTDEEMLKALEVVVE
jgi:3-dehydroquinate synthase